MYVVTIEINNYNPITRNWERQELTGEFDCKSEDDAIKQAKEFYANELGTTEDEIKILEITKK